MANNNQINWNPNQQNSHGYNVGSSQQYQQQQHTTGQQQYDGNNAYSSSNNPLPYHSQYQMNSQPSTYAFSQHQVGQPPVSYPINSSGQNQTMQSTNMYPQHNHIPGQPTYPSYPSPSAYNYNYGYGQQTQAPPPPPPPPKEKIIMTDEKPISEQYQCDPCAVSFPTKQALQAHTNAHIKCSKCAITGSKKVISAHFKATHGEYAGRGLKTVSVQLPGSRAATQRFKICVGSHPDDIKAWIAERKKRFPTRENLAKKALKNKRSREEGAVADGNNRSVGDLGGGCDKKQRTTNDGTVVTNTGDESVPPASSISNLIAGYGSSTDEDEGEKIDGAATKNQDAKVENKEVPVPDNSTKNLPSEASHFKTKLCRYFLRNGTCKNGDECPYIHDMAQRDSHMANAEIRKEKQRQRDRARNEAQNAMSIITTGRKQGIPGRRAAPPTLLRKLLQSDIRRERSLTLQALRYIVDCNYLQERRDGDSNIKDA